MDVSRQKHCVKWSTNHIKIGINIVQPSPEKIGQFNDEAGDRKEFKKPHSCNVYYDILVINS